MGQAKKRGDIEQRRSQAIEAGRKKSEPKEHRGQDPAITLARVLKFGLHRVAPNSK